MFNQRKNAFETYFEKKNALSHSHIYWLSLFLEQIVK